MSTATNTIEALANREYKYGFVTEIESDVAPRGLNEDIVRLISAKKNEPEWMLEWRLKAYRHWADAGKVGGGAEVGERPLPADRLPGHHLLRGAEADDEGARAASTRWTRKLLATFEKLGIPLEEQKRLSRRGGRRGLRQRLGGDHLQGRSWPSSGSSSAPSPRRCRIIRSWSRSISARWCPTPTTSSPR